MRAVEEVPHGVDLLPNIGGIAVLFKKCLDASTVITAAFTKPIREIYPYLVIIRDSDGCVDIMFCLFSVISVLGAGEEQ